MKSKWEKKRQKWSKLAADEFAFRYDLAIDVYDYLCTKYILIDVDIKSCNCSYAGCSKRSIHLRPIMGISKKKCCIADKQIEIIKEDLNENLPGWHRVICKLIAEEA